MRSFALLTAAVLLQGTYVLAQPLGVAWLTEGKVFVVRGATLYGISDGLKVLGGDIITTEAKSQVQIQFTDGTIVNAGPRTRVMVEAGAKGAEPELALAEGWLKLVQKPAAKPMRVWTTPLAATFDGATVVMRASPDSVEAFVESGSMNVSERAERGGAAARKVRATEFYTHGPRQRGVQPRPTRAFIEGMPRHYRDPLPAVPEKVKSRNVEPRREREVDYEDVADWLKTSMPVRRGFVRRFLPRVGDPQFRARLAAHVRDHPEWDRILFPEKYEQKAVPGASGKAAKDIKPQPASGGKP